MELDLEEYAKLPPKIQQNISKCFYSKLLRPKVEWPEWISSDQYRSPNYYDSDYDCKNCSSETHLIIFVNNLTSVVKVLLSYVKRVKNVIWWKKMLFRNFNSGASLGGADPFKWSRRILMGVIDAWAVKTWIYFCY